MLGQEKNQLEKQLTDLQEHNAHLQQQLSQSMETTSNNAASTFSESDTAALLDELREENMHMSQECKNCRQTINQLQVSAANHMNNALNSVNMSDNQGYATMRLAQLPSAIIRASAP